MQYTQLGRTGVSVSRFCLGAMMFGAWGNRDHDDCVRMVHTAQDAGVNFIDTADMYSDGESEEIVAKALAGARRDRVVLATKFFAPMGDDRNMMGASRRWIFQEVESSLRRLGTDWIDLYQVHRPDLNVDHDETLSALTDLVQQGKVRYIGSSTFPAEAIVEAQWVAERRNRQRYVCEQPPYSIFAREIERAVLPTCRRFDLGVIAWSPLAGGWLSGKFRRGEKVESRRAQRVPDRFDPALPGNQAKLDAVEELVKIAEGADLSLVHMATAWVLEHPGITAAIIGPRTADQLDDLLACADTRLDADVLDAIDGVVAPGVTLNAADAGWTPPGLVPHNRRRSR